MKYFTIAIKPYYNIKKAFLPAETGISNPYKKQQEEKSWEFYSLGCLR